MEYDRLFWSHVVEDVQQNIRNGSTPLCIIGYYFILEPGDIYIFIRGITPMKKLILFSLAAIFLSVIGCTKPDDGGKDTPPTPPQEQITIPSTVDVTPVVAPEGGDSKISFTAAAAWTASVISTKADSWVDVNPKSGNPGPAEIKITTTPNDTYVERNATIQIKCGTETKDIVLTQKGKTFIHVTEVTFDKSEITLVEDEKVTLVATIVPEDATDKSVEWSSDKPEVASVDDKGEVTAKASGTATITVTTNDGQKSAVCDVRVIKDGIIDIPIINL